MEERQRHIQEEIDAEKRKFAIDTTVKQHASPFEHRLQLKQNTLFRPSIISSKMPSPELRPVISAIEPPSLSASLASQEPINIVVIPSSDERNDQKQ
jgi:hypothetical protein